MMNLSAFGVSVLILPSSLDKFGRLSTGLTSDSKNSETYLWEAPVAMPTDDKRYEWDEATTSWVEAPAL